MAAELFIPPSKALDANANPYAGAKWFFYATGTTTPQSVYTTAALSVAHTNPVVADSSGKFANIFFDPALVYRGVLKNADESVTLHDIDPVNSDFGRFTQTGTGAVARTVEAKLRERGSPEDFGAVGDGTTDDTANFNKALAACKTVILGMGKTYLVTALTSSVDDQLIMAHGATVKLKDGQTTGNILVLSGARQKVFGGTWDGNRANQTGAAFAYSCIATLGSYTEIAHATVKNSRSLGISGGGGDYLNIHDNTALDCRDYGIYVEKTTADGIGNQIKNNLVINTTDVATHAIYLTGSNEPFTYKQRAWEISGNICFGPTASPTAVGITARATEGVCTGNQTNGYDIGLSLDITADSTVTGNRCFNANGTTGYCIEINGGGNTITGNKTKGGKYGLSMTQGFASIPMDRNTVSGNNFDSPTVGGVFYQATIGSASAKYSTFADNTVLSVSTTLIAFNITGSACARISFSNNTCIGPGSGVASSRAYFFDAVNSRINIRGGTVSGYERAVACFNNTATAYTNVKFEGVDCSEDVGGAPAFLNAEGTATIGAGCVVINNVINAASNFRRDYLDYGGNIFCEFSDTYATPEGNLAAGIGSEYNSYIGGAGTTKWVKQTGTGNTGWASVT